MGARHEQPILPSGQGTSEKSKVPGQSRRKPGSTKNNKASKEDPNNGKCISFIMSFPRAVLVTSAHLELDKYTPPNLSFVERLKKSKPILFLQMF